MTGERYDYFLTSDYNLAFDRYLRGEIKMKKYRMVVKFNYYAVLEMDAESKEDFKEKADALYNDEICGEDMIPTNSLEFDGYEDIEEVEEDEI